MYKCKYEVNEQRSTGTSRSEGKESQAEERPTWPVKNLKLNSYSVQNPFYFRATSALTVIFQVGKKQVDILFRW